jgi:predicted nucleic acid-binding protein
MHPKYNIVIDTGVLISAFAFGGAPAKAELKAFHNANNHVSSQLLKEYRATPVTLHNDYSPINFPLFPAKLNPFG